MSRRPNRPQQGRQRAAVQPAESLVDDYEDEDLDEVTGPDEDLDEDDDDLYAEDEPVSYEDADAFFAAEVATVRPAVLHYQGRDYVLPVRTPLAFNLLAERNATEESLESFRRVLVPVFGEGTLDEWIDGGMNERQLAVILMFAAQNMERPGSATLGDCARRYDEEQARGKALNRAQRRAAGERSSRTGASSSRTSSARTRA